MSYKLKPGFSGTWNHSINYSIQNRTLGGAVYIYYVNIFLDILNFLTDYGELPFSIHSCIVLAFGEHGAPKP